MVRDGLARRRQAIVFGLAQRISDRFEGMLTQVPAAEEEGDRSWTQVESLSQLRSAVGGRFQNLKEKWIASGFPLRKHRGDRREQATIDMHGWTRLALWIDKQGYDVRLAEPDDVWLFEVRKREKSDSDYES